MPVSIAPVIDETYLNLVGLLIGLSTHDNADALMSSSPTPQNMALQWLAEDPLVDSYSDQQKVQRFVLATLFFSTDGPQWIHSDGWLTDSDECTWFSYTELCDGSGSLLQVDLRENSLRGTVPIEVSWLESLEKLNLRENQISGHIPSELGILRSLAFLQFTDNAMTGTLPSELARLGSLGTILSCHCFPRVCAKYISRSYPYMLLIETMGLGGNEFEGEIPTAYATLTRLARLRLDDNAISGTIPTEFGSMTSLELVDLYGNALTGTIPTELGSLPLLVNLTVSSNDLSGTVPDELCSHSNDLYISADCDSVDCPCCSEC